MNTEIISLSELQTRDCQKDYPVYHGSLGSTCGPEGTCFRLWAPNAEKVTLRLFHDGIDGGAYARFDMKVSENGTWVYFTEENLSGVYYTYQVEGLPETIDPYAKACGVNGVRGMVLDLSLTDPDGFDNDHGPWINNPVDMIITETSVCDATIDLNADCKWPGKYLGLTQEGCKSKNGYAAGLDHLCSLGITHLQIMPFYDFASIDESLPDAKKYNWGYDPLNFNIPEGSYATDPFHGEVRIKECKQMIQALHAKGIGVIMDVVYNHVYEVERSSLQRTVPDYFFRMTTDERTGKKLFSNGSGCGNEFASERAMARKYMIDSLCYWVEEYHIDGFRFDLMGVFDLETLNLAAAKLRSIRPDIVLYGEGWGGGLVAYPENLRGVKSNVTLLDGFGVFSDDIRDHIKGNVFDSRDQGFVNGKKDKENDIRFTTVAAVKHPQVDLKKYTYSNGKAWAENPAQVINYVSCHDNFTLWDKLELSCPDSSKAERIKMNKLCAAIIMTAQGTPFFLSGEEFARSKPDDRGYLSGNSYNLSFETNGLHYDRIEEFEDLLEYYKGLIAFRKAHPALRLRTRQEIADQLVFLENLPANVVAFRVKSDQEELLIAYNANSQNVYLTTGDAIKWSLRINGEEAGDKELGLIGGSREIVIHGCSALAAVRI